MIIFVINPINNDIFTFVNLLSLKNDEVDSSKHRHQPFFFIDKNLSKSL